MVSTGLEMLCRQREVVRSSNELSLNKTIANFGVCQVSPLTKTSLPYVRLPECLEYKSMLRSPDM
jgi:hypothetical protein